MVFKMGSLVPGSEGEGRLSCGYGALDDSIAFQEGDGVFTESRGLEPHMLDLLDRRYKIYGAHEEQLNPAAFSPVPLGRQAVMGESLGQSATFAQSSMVPITYRDQPESIEKHVGRQPESNLWRAEGGEEAEKNYGKFEKKITPPSLVEQVTTFAKENPLFTVAIVAGIGLVGYYLYKR
jgi:hypothetical protein